MTKKTGPRTAVTRHGHAKAPAHQEHTKEQRQRAAKRLGEQEQHWWNYDDLLALTGMTRNTLYRHVSRGTIDPAKLESVLYWVARHGNMQVKRKLLDYALEAGNSKNPAVE